jgi:precorrin-2 dehydrogenase/sirohydrochlorin ferrochelatase
MNDKNNSIYYPLLLNLKKFPCLVIGGGNVALRKVISLLEFNARVTVISPKLCEQLYDLHQEGKIQIIQRYYSKEYLDNYKIVFCATDNPKTNQKVYQDCKDENILLNVADVPELCDFILPANVKRGNLTISIASQGKAPFYVKEIKNKLNHIFSSSYEDIIGLAGDFRKLLLSNKKYKSSKIKEKAFKKFFTFDWKEVLANEGKKKANEYMHQIFKEL